MTHANDLALVVRDLLRADPSVYRATLREGALRTDGAGYAYRDGSFFVDVLMKDGRGFQIQVTTEDDPAAAGERAELSEPPWAQHSVRPIAGASS